MPTKSHSANIMNRGLPSHRAPSHPGEILREEFLTPLGVSGNALSLSLRVPANRISLILREERGITPDTALRLARYFGTSAEFWMNLQKSHDLSKALMEQGPQIEREVLPHETVG